MSLKWPEESKKKARGILPGFLKQLQNELKFLLSTSTDTFEYDNTMSSIFYNIGKSEICTEIANDHDATYLLKTLASRLRMLSDTINHGALVQNLQQLSVQLGEKINSLIGDQK